MCMKEDNPGPKLFKGDNLIKSATFEKIASPV